jgi:hypothetical protein
MQITIILIWIVDESAGLCKIFRVKKFEGLVVNARWRTAPMPRLADHVFLHRDNRAKEK